MGVVFGGVWLWWYVLSSLFCWLRQCWRRCVGCCVVVTVSKKKKTTSVISKKMSREGIYRHYGFNLFEKSKPASNYEFYRFH